MGTRPFSGPSILATCKTLDAKCASFDDEATTQAFASAIAPGVALAWREKMLAHVPALAALQSDDKGRLVAEFRLARLRSQVAVVRALADYVEALAQSGDADGLSNQVTEEMARLGCRLLEAAAALVESKPPLQSAASGVFIGVAEERPCG